MGDFIFDVGVMKRIAVFSAVSDDKLEALRPAIRHRRYRRGASILSVGERADGVHVLLSGRAKVVIEDEHGREMTLSVIDPNELFGEVGVLDEGLRPAGVKALEPSETLYIPTLAFLECIDGNFKAAMHILRSVVRRLRTADHKLATLGLVDVYGRVARLLVESAQEVDGQWIVETGSEEIARTVAASREMVSRVVKKMKKDGLLRKEKRRTVILDRRSMDAACSL